MFDAKLLNDSFRQYFEVFQPLEWTLQHLNPVAQITINVFGILGAALGMFVILGNEYSEQTEFRTLESSTLISSLVFSALNIWVTVAERYKLETDSLAQFLMFVLAYLVVEMASEVCDWCSIVLMFSRYMSLLKPMYWYSRSRQWKSRFCCGSVAVIVSVWLSRLLVTISALCSLGPPPSFNGTYSYDYVEVKHALNEDREKKILASLPLPLIVVTLMTYLTAHSVILLKRSARVMATPLQQEVRIGMSSSQAETSNGRTTTRRDMENRNMTFLVLASGICLILCRLTAVSAAVASILFMHHIKNCVKGCSESGALFVRSLTAHLYLGFISNSIIESFTMAYRFYAYLLFCKSFRMNFKARCSSIFQRRN